MAAVASSPVSGVLAPAHASGCCVLKYMGPSCGWNALADAQEWEPVLPDGGAGAMALLPERMNLPPLVFSGLSLSAAAVCHFAGSLPLYIVNESLLFYDFLSI